MTRRSREVGIIKSFVLGAALAAALAVPAQAGDNKLALSATAVFTTDYMFRSISQHGTGPAVQPEFDLTYGMFYAGIWGSNTDCTSMTSRSITTPASPEMELERHLQHRRLSTTPIRAPTRFDYFELKTGAILDRREPGPLASTTIGRRIISGASATLMRSRDRSAMPSRGKLFNFFSPSISGILGFQSYEEDRCRLHLLECRPDPRLHGALVGRRPLLGYRS